MNSKERVIKAIKFDNPDRIPITHSCMPGFIDRYGEKAEKLFFRFPGDFSGEDGRYSGSEALTGHRRGGKDEWGCVWTKPVDGYSEGEVIKPALDKWDKLKDYVFPDFTPSMKDIENIEKHIKREKHSKNPRYVLKDFGGRRTWERYHILRGFANALIDVAEDNPNMYELLNRIAEINIKALKVILELDVDGVVTMDDWGTQSTLMINPVSWRKIFKPIYKKYIDLAHQAGKDFYLHSDGNTFEIIDDWIEIGLDVLNPQFSCMDLDKLAGKVKAKMCICSDIDRQYILPKGQPDEVREYVKKVIEIFGKGGGLIGGGELGPDVPLKNAEIMFETFYSSGQN